MTPPPSPFVLFCSRIIECEVEVGTLSNGTKQCPKLVAFRLSFCSNMMCACNLYFSVCCWRTSTRICVEFTVFIDPSLDVSGDHHWRSGDTHTDRHYVTCDRGVTQSHQFHPFVTITSTQLPGRPFSRGPVLCPPGSHLNWIIIAQY